MPRIDTRRLKAKPETTALAASLERMLEEGDSTRVEGLAAFRTLQGAAQLLYQHEAIRLKARLGAEHPRVRDLELRMKVNPALLSAAASALGRTKAAEPAPVPDRAVVYGRVLDGKTRGLEGLTVAWEDDRGQPIRALGEVKTDATGRFIATLSAESLAKMPQDGAWITVRNAGGALLHRESAPVKPSLGERAELSVALDRRGGSSSSTVVTRPARTESAGPAGRRPVAEPWIAKGQVVDAGGEGVMGLLVTAYDQDRLFDDTLGAALTGKDGSFSITYGRREFKEGAEPGPDLYLAVTDVSERELHRTPVRYDAGREEAFHIRLGGGDNQAPPGEDKPPPTGRAAKTAATSKPRTRKKGGAK
jgi:hypothetical protein